MNSEKLVEVLELVRPPCMELVAIAEMYGKQCLGVSISALLEDCLSNLLTKFNLIRNNVAYSQQLPKALHFIMVPLNFVLNITSDKQTRESIAVSTREKLLRCMSLLIEICGERFVEGIRPSAMVLLSSALIIQLEIFSSHSNQGIKPFCAIDVRKLNGAEEALQLTSLNCLNSLLLASSQLSQRANKVMCQQRWHAFSLCLISASNGNFVAIMVNLFLDVSLHGQSREVKLAALEVLGRTIQFLPDTNLWRRYFPGIFSGLYLVVKGMTSISSSETCKASLLATKQGSSVTEKSLKVLAIIVKVVFKDSTQEANHSDSKEISPLQILHDMSKTKKVTIPSTDVEPEVEWPRETIPKMIMHFQSLLDFCRRHESWRVRSAVVDLANELLPIWTVQNESDVLQNCTLNTLLGLLWDDMPQVAEAAHGSLKRYREEHLSKSDWLTDRLTRINNAIVLADSLPGLAKCSAVEKNISAQLNLLSGYLTLLETDLNQFETKWATIFKNLCEIVEFDNDTRMQVVDSWTALNAIQVHNIRHILKYCREDSTILSVNRTLQLLGKSSNPWFVCNVLIDALNNFVSIHTQLETNSSRAHSNNDNQREMKMLTSICYASNYCLLGIKNEKNMLPPGMAELVVQNILNSNLWNLKTSTCLDQDQASSDNVSISVLKNRVALICQMIECIGTVTECCDKDTLEVLLVDLLYPLLDKLADNSVIVQQSAITTLHRISTTLKYDNLHQFIDKNMDHIVDAAVMQLKQMGTRSGNEPYNVVAKLLGQLKITATTPLIYDLTLSVLSHIDTGWANENSLLSSLKVMQVILQSMDMTNVHSLVSTLPEKNKRRKNYSHGFSLADSVYFQQLFLEFGSPHDSCRESPMNKSCSNQESFFDDSIDDNEVDEARIAQAVKDSREIQIITKILERGCYFLSTAQLHCQAISAEIICDCLVKLSETRLETILLPAVHKTWPSLMSRFREQASAINGTHRKGPLSVYIGRENDEKRANIEQRRAIMLHLTDAIRTIVDLCGDFLSLKVSEELWPVIKVLLIRNLPKLTGKSENSLTKIDQQIYFREQKTLNEEDFFMKKSSIDQFMDVKVAVALLNCMTSLVVSNDCQLYTTPLVSDIASTVLPGLSKHAPVTISNECMSLFRGMIMLDCDFIWVLLLKQICEKEAKKILPNRLPLPNYCVPIKVQTENSSQFEPNAIILLQEIQNLKELFS